MTTINKLKKPSFSIDRLTKEIDKINAPTTRAEDTRFWQPEVDKAGNGQAIVRLLPPPVVDGEDALPWVRVFSHSFQGPTGKWYINNSLTTINQKDPVSELNTQLWSQSTDDNSPGRKQARAQKRKLTYISNILVISDPKHPENEGKVFLFKYGKKIFDKITAAMKPEFEGDTPVNPFDLDEGVNLRIKIKTVDGYRNYDSSTFEANPTPIKNWEEVWSQANSLAEFVAPDKFDTYENLKARLYEVLGHAATPAGPLTPKVSSDSISSAASEFEVDDSIPWETNASSPSKRFADLLDDDE